MKFIKRNLPVLLILFVVFIFFLPVFKGQIPFPGDLLVNVNPYNATGYLDFAPGGYPNKAQGPDVINEIYPWRFFSINQLKEFEIPFWNPHNFSGNPQIANFQTAIFYPFNLLYFILPFNLSWTIIIMLQPILAGIFMYLFLKKGIGTKEFPSLIASISFAFSSYMTVWLEYGNIGNTFLWLPLVLLLTKYFFEKQKNIILLAISLSLSFAILAGYIQGAFYIYSLSFLYYLFLALNEKELTKNYKKHILFLISLILPIFLTAFQILPTLELFSQSTRGAYTISQIEKNLTPLFTWITIFFPDFFGNPATRNYWIDGTYIERVMYPGAISIFFAFYAIFGKANFLEKKFFILTAIISLIIATKFLFIKYFYLIPIPVISTTIPTRELSIFIFSVIVLGAMGLDLFLREKSIRAKTVVIYSIFFIGVWILVFALSNLMPVLAPNLMVTKRNLVLPTIFAVLIISVLFIKKKNIRFAILIIFIVCVFDLFYFFGKITPFSSNKLVYPKTPLISYVQNTAGIDRFWGYGSAYIPANFQSVDKTYSPEGNDPLHISRYGELLSSSQNGKLPNALPRPDANIAGGYGQDDLKTNFYRKRILDLLGVKYIVHKKDLTDEWVSEDLTTFPKNQYKLIYKVYPWQVYENLNVLPRFFVTADYIVANNKSHALSLIYNPDVNLKKTIILEEKPGINIEKSSKGQAKLISYKPNNVLFNTSSTGNAFLFLSDNFYSDWEVRIDGRKSKIFIADYTFRAVAVPKGNHRIEFVYNPKMFKLGLVVSMLTTVLIIVVGYMLLSKKRQVQ